MNRTPVFAGLLLSGALAFLLAVQRIHHYRTLLDEVRENVMEGRFDG